MENSTRLVHLQIARAIAALMVLCYHLMFVEMKYSNFAFLSGWAEWGRYGVDVFFAISGFIMVWTTRRHTAGLGSAARFLYRRALRIYPLYWLFTTLVLAVFLWRPDLVNSSFSQPPDILYSYLLLPQEGLPLLAVGWSLEYELYFYAVFALLLLLPRRWLLPALVGWAGLLVLAQQFLSPSTPLGLIAASPLCFEFIAGAVLGCFVKEPAAAEETAPKRSLLVAIGDGSYALYLSHVLVISALGRLWALTDNSSVWLHLFWLLGSALLAVLFGLLTHRLIERPMMLWIRDQHRAQGRIGRMYFGRATGLEGQAK